MRRFVILLALGALVLFPLPAAAESREWTADGPKHPDQYYVWCTARGEAGGDSYTMHNYVDTYQNPGWRVYADRVFRDDVQRAFRFGFGREISRDAITVDCG